jgi:hypothetical protein
VELIEAGMGWTGDRTDVFRLTKQHRWSHLHLCCFLPKLACLFGELPSFMDYLFTGNGNADESGTDGVVAQRSITSTRTEYLPGLA